MLPLSSDRLVRRIGVNDAAQVAVFKAFLFPFEENYLNAGGKFFRTFFTRGKNDYCRFFQSCGNIRRFVFHTYEKIGHTIRKDFPYAIIAH